MSLHDKPVNISIYLDLIIIFWYLILFSNLLSSMFAINFYLSFVLMLFVPFIERTAYDVSLADDSWPSDAFGVISGSTSKSWEKLDV